MRKIIILLNLILFSSAFAAGQIQCPGTNGIPQAVITPSVSGSFSPQGCTEEIVGNWLQQQCGQCPGGHPPGYPYGVKFNVKADWTVRIKGENPQFPNGVTEIVTSASVTCEQKGNRAYCPGGQVDGSVSGNLNWKADASAAWTTQVNGQNLQAVINTASPSTDTAKQLLQNYIQKNGAGTFGFSPNKRLNEPWAVPGKGCDGNVPVKRTDNLCELFVSGGPVKIINISKRNLGGGKLDQDTK